MQSIEAFFPLITIPKNVVITAHQKPDGDAMGSSLGLLHFLKKFNHQVTFISPTNWADFLKWMPGANDVIDFEADKDNAKFLINNADYIFCLDFNTLSRTKNLAPLLENTTAQKILIDHHQQPQIEAFTYGVSNTNKSSTCQMVYDFIVDAGYKHLIDNDIATCLYAGTVTDTGSFRFNSTTAEVHKMVAFFLEVGINNAQIHNNLFDNFLENRLRFIGNALLNRMEVLYQYNTAVMSIPKYDIKKYEIKTGDTEGLVNYLQSITGIKLAAIVIDRDEERKWSFRSKDNFDVNEFARKHFEGGGHKMAAGGRSSDSLQQTYNHFLTVIKQYETELNSN